MLTDEQKQRLYDEIDQEISYIAPTEVKGFRSAEDVDDTHPVCIAVLGVYNRHYYWVTVDFAKFAVTEVRFDYDEERSMELYDDPDPDGASAHMEGCHSEINELVCGIQSVLDKFKDEIEG